MNGATMQKDIPLVLVVDDDQPTRLVMRHTLEHNAYAVAEANDGEQALAAFQQLQPDLVLLDAAMPVMDGFEACVRLRQLPGGNRTPILMVTGLNDAGSVERAFEAGATDYITKPIHWPVLHQRLRRILQASRMEARLVASEERVQAMVQYALDGIITCDARGVVEFCNSAAERIFGYSVGEIIGQPVQMLFDQLDQVREVASIATREATGRRKGGIAFPVELSVSQFTADDQKRCTIILRDITERRRAEKALRRHDAILEAITFSAERFLKATGWEQEVQGMLERLGMAAEASRAYVFENSVVEDGTPLTRQRYEWVAPGITPQMDNPELQDALWQAGDMGRWEAILSRGDVIAGHVKDFPASEQAVLTSQGIRSILIVPVFAGQEWWGHIGFDDCLAEREWLTAEIEALRLAASILGAAIQRQRTEKALQRRHRGLSLLNRAGQELAATLDFQQIGERLSQAITEAFYAEGSSMWLWDEERPGELICRVAFQRGQSRSPVNLRLPPGQGIAGQVAQTGMSVIVTRAPEDPRFFSEIDAQIGFRTTSLLAVPLRVRGETIGVLELVNKQNGDFDADDCDLAETLAASAAIAIDNARLVEALRQQTTELQARNEELDAFAHTVAHDLKNPLHLITGFAEALRVTHSTMSAEELGEYLLTIAQNGRRMHNIIDELLLLAQMRQKEVEMRPLDMAGIVNEARQRLSYLIKEYQGQIIVPTQWPVALGHAAWVEEVWINYISNALKYGGRPPRVELGFSIADFRLQPVLWPGTGIAEAPPGEAQSKIQNLKSQIKFWVRDNGPGLTPEEQARLFTPFTRLDQVRARGHGLGLSIVRRIVEKLGGQVGVESEVGRGSFFFFTLPGAEREA